MIAGAARVLSRHVLVYPQPTLLPDQSPHVRAASGLAWLSTSAGPRLVLAQDDTSFLAVLDTHGNVERPLSLPHAVEGRKVFESRLGNKEHKLDLESCARLPDALFGGPRVLIVGSGSLPARERMVLVAEDQLTLYSLPELYAALRHERGFSGSELNVEGAAVVGDTLFLANRGNGAAQGGREPVDALISLSLKAFAAHLAGGPLPVLSAPRALDLGALSGVRLTVTDLCATPGGTLFFLAASEASPNAVDDGEVFGTALGRIDESGVRMVQLFDEEGAALTAKVEGLVWADPEGAGDEILVVVDRDDPDLPSECLRIRVPSALLSGEGLPFTR